MSVGFIKIKDFEKFQHYHNRTPPWIKLYNHLLEDREFQQLDDKDKCHLMLIWLLASRLDNKIPNDPEWIQGRIGTKTIPRIEVLSKKRLGQDGVETGGWLIIEGGKNEEGAKEGEGKESPATEKSGPGIERSDGGDELSPLSRAWNELCPNLPHVVSLSKARRKKERDRLAQRPLTDWIRAFQKVNASIFCRGGKDGSGWKATYDWIVHNEDNYLKVIEGKYDGKGPEVKRPPLPPKPPEPPKKPLTPEEEAEFSEARKRTIAMLGGIGIPIRPLSDGDKEQYG